MNNIFGFVLLLSSQIWARDVQIAMALSKPPYIFEESASGLECDIIREAFKAVNIEFKPIFAPINRGVNLYKTNKADGAINKLENSLEGFPSDPYIDYYNVAASLKSKKLSIQKVDDLEPFAVAAFQTARTMLGKDFEKIMSKSPKYTEVAEQKMQVEQLLRKRVDVIIGDVLIIKYYQRKFKEDSGLNEEIAIHDLFPTSSYRIIFKTAELRDLFNKGLAIIRKNKTYSGIISQYTGAEHLPIIKKESKKTP